MRTVLRITFVHDRLLAVGKRKRFSVELLDQIRTDRIVLSAVRTVDPFRKLLIFFNGNNSTAGMFFIISLDSLPVFGYTIVRRTRRKGRFGRRTQGRFVIGYLRKFSFFIDKGGLNPQLTIVRIGCNNGTTRAFFILPLDILLGFGYTIGRELLLIA